MERSPLIAVYKTSTGWCFYQAEDVGYYSSFPEIKYVHYWEEWEAIGYGRVKQGNKNGNDGRPSESDRLP